MEEEEDDDEARNCFAAARRRVVSTGSVSVATVHEAALDSTSSILHNRTIVVATEGHNGENNLPASTTSRSTRRELLGYQVYNEESCDSYDNDDEEEEDEEEEEEEEEENDVGGSGVPPLTKRIKMTKSRETELQANADDFWAAFDGQVMVKSIIGGVLKWKMAGSQMVD